MFRRLLVVLLPVLCILSAAADEQRKYAPHGMMLQLRWQKMFRDNMERYRSRIGAAESREDALAIVREARERVRRTFSFPEKRCPLNARVTGVLRGKGFRVEKILFESRENFTVTANMYLPENVSGKIPAVLFLSGHSKTGKGYINYAASCINLVNCKVAVLAIDPIHQGERGQFKSAVPAGVYGHNIINRQLLVTGDSFSAWRAYDGIRAIDYLLTRPEVDPARIGIHGNSGGGTMTSIISACDDRIAAAAPCCYITTFLANVENELPVDAEQMPPGFLRNGGEMADWLIAQAPRPTGIFAKDGDFFDPRGTLETYRMVRKIYTLLGYPDNIRMESFPGGHGFSPAMITSSGKFFSEVFGTGIKTPPALPASVPSAAELAVLGGKGVLSLPNERTAADYVFSRVVELEKQRKKLNRSRAEITALLRKNLCVPEKIAVPAWRRLRGVNPAFYRCSRYALAVDEAIDVTLYIPGAFLPDAAGKDVVLYVPDRSSRTELPAQKVPAGTLLAGIDVRGTGDSEPSTCNDNNRTPGAEYNYEYHYSSCGIIFGRPLAGERAADILAAAELLRANGAKSITLRAAGNGIVPAIFAAALSRGTLNIQLAGKLVTFKEACSRELPGLLTSQMPFKILQIADLDELLELAASR